MGVYIIIREVFFMGEPINCQTFLEFEIELDERVQNQFSFALDMDLFWLALALQLIRDICREPDDCSKEKK
jgi:hypothetical protein